jgi:hypothetical protein
MNAQGATMNLAHSHGKPGVLPSTTNISVRFVSDPPFELLLKNTMKMPAWNHEPMMPSLFQIAARMDVSATASTATCDKPPTTQPVRTPFVDLMSNPKQLKAALLEARMENETFDVSRKFKRAGHRIPRRTRNGAHNTSLREINRNRTNEISVSEKLPLKKTEFVLMAPAAKSVQLAADFTEWEKFPLEMIRSENGVWFTIVPLSPGHYSYRFIVDGEWCDDLDCPNRMPNSFGAAEAVRKIV